MAAERERPQIDVQRPRCPFCHDGISPEQEKVGCDACMAWHHEGCWREHGKCSACGAEKAAGLSEDATKRATPNDIHGQDPYDPVVVRGGARPRFRRPRRDLLAHEEIAARWEDRPATPRRRPVGQCAHQGCLRPAAIHPLRGRYLCRAHSQTLNGTILTALGILGSVLFAIVTAIATLEVGLPSEAWWAVACLCVASAALAAGGIALVRRGHRMVDTDIELARKLHSFKKARASEDDEDELDGEEPDSAQRTPVKQ